MEWERQFRALGGWEVLASKRNIGREVSTCPVLPSLGFGSQA